MRISSFIRRKLGIDQLATKKEIDALPALNERYLKLLTPLEALMTCLLEPEGDDSLVMHKLRCMGYCGGWKSKEQYEKGKAHGRSEAKN